MWVPCLPGESDTLFPRNNDSRIAAVTINLQGPSSLFLCGFLLAFGDPAVAWLGMEEDLESRFVKMER